MKMSNTQIARTVVEELEKMNIKAEYEEVLNNLDISRVDEDEEITQEELENVINNFVQKFEVM